MDTISQIALGASVGHLVLGRRLGRRALLIGAVLGTAPDLDVLIRYTDAVDSFTRHRSYSHSLLVLTLISPLVATLVQRFAARGVRWRRCWLAVWLILVTHVLLDGFTVYGTQLLWPLDMPPVAWGSLFIIDPLYTLPLLVALLVIRPWRRHRVTSRTRRRSGRRGVLVGVVLSTAYVGWTLVAQQQALTAARASLDEQGIETESLRVSPFPFSLLWRILAIEGNRYHEGYVSLLDPPGSITFDTYPRGNELLVDAIGSHDPVQRMRWFTGDQMRAEIRDEAIVLTDLRIGAESNYVFEFAVADKVVSSDGDVDVDGDGDGDGSGDGSGDAAADRMWQPVVSRALTPQIDLTIIGDIWRRMWDPAVDLTPDPARDATTNLNSQ